jgi:hypothetical protein
MGDASADDVRKAFAAIQAMKDKQAAARAALADLRETARELYWGATGPVLLDSVVTFLDELGTSEAMPGLTNQDLKRTIELNESLTQTFHVDDVYEGNDRIVTFSDNIVVGRPADTSRPDGGLLFHVDSAAHYQFEMAMEGRFVRGGVARGPLYIDDAFVTGDGLIRAHALESKTAVFPRILLSHDVMDGFTQEAFDYFPPASSPQYDLVLVDADGHPFVNYLSVLDDAYDDEDAVERSLAKHQKVVEAAIAKFANKPSVRDKYRWVADYHNWVCTNYYSRPGFIITAGLTQFEIEHPRQFVRLITPEQAAMNTP